MLTECQACHTPVLETSEGTCPNCQAVLSGTRRVASSSCSTSEPGIQLSESSQQTPIRPKPRQAGGGAAKILVWVFTIIIVVVLNEAIFGSWPRDSVSYTLRWVILGTPVMIVLKLLFGVSLQ